DRGAHDPFVECAHQIRLEVLLDWHPEALLDLFCLHDDVLRQWREPRNEVDVRLAISVPVPMPKADQRVEARLHAGFLEHFAQHGVNEMLAGLERATWQLVVRLLVTTVPLAHDQNLRSEE